jgi:metal-dependent amidase/aminoacylase/carboxypeptidase family protein
MTGTWERTDVGRVATALDADLIALRRELHQWPELAGMESRTAAAVAQRLRDAGLSVTTGLGGHGVLAVLDGAAPGRTVAYRADMDAIAADEPRGAEFASRVPGAAHLCGHDLHTAIAVGIAQVLARLRHTFTGRVAFVFQPAEETLEGARAMLDDGVLDRVAPEEIYALHCGPLPVGTFAVLPGVGQPGLDLGQVHLSGPDAAGTAERLRQAIVNLATIREPRSPEEFPALLDDLRNPDGRLARFVYAHAEPEPGVDGTVPGADGTVTLRLFLRTWPDSRYPSLREEVRDLAAAVGGRVEFPRPPFPAMVCSPELSHAAADRLREVPGVAAVEVFGSPYPFAGEDFGLFLQRVPGAMFYLGVSDPERGINGVPHWPDFAADERAIGLGVRAMADFLVSRLA